MKRDSSEAPSILVTDEAKKLARLIESLCSENNPPVVVNMSRTEAGHVIIAHYVDEQGARQAIGRLITRKTNEVAYSLRADRIHEGNSVLVVVPYTPADSE